MLLPVPLEVHKRIKKRSKKEMDVQECFQVPPAELVPHQPFEKAPLINLHEMSLLALFLLSCFVLGQRVALVAMYCFWCLL